MAGDDDSGPPSPPPPPNTPTYHPAFAVPNIKNHICVTLDNEDAQYATWVELFQITAVAFNVLDHIDAKTPRPKEIDDATWNRLDAIVKNWIYGTISKDLFAKTKLENFANMSDYCKQLKLLADQLANVDCPVSDRKMVMQLIAGLTMGEYDTVAAIVSQSEPTPTFNKARCMFILEETRQNKQSEAGQHALVAQSSPMPASQSSAPSPASQSTTDQQGGIGRGRGKGRNTSSKGKGRGKGRGSNSSNNNQHQQSGPNHNSAQQAPQWGNQQGWAPPQQGQWASPPCPYPTGPTNSPFPYRG
ncbi:uncharacterized protein LOC110693401 [Chenopodium quinoa]|uniref:uncharacterized protein LOC110693401 n=1 Tax=Chenopodium quinoa TaxID=63459 RepID=UPI000B793636|nr:uncharacterized protein LOC110693401 [Chenopodium quinoa]